MALIRLVFSICGKPMALRPYGRNISISSTCGTKASSLVYEQHGDPEKVVEKVSVDIPRALNLKDILVRLLVAPVNPADINTIQGTYGVSPPLPAVGGNEGVAEVIDVGDAVRFCRPGDRVIPAIPGCGTWRTHSIMFADQLRKVPDGVPDAEAAMVAVNACTAYRMLCDYELLKRDDVIMQNGANSGVGQNVIQIAREMGLLSINIVRDRDDMADLKRHLMALGANYVFTEDSFRKEGGAFFKNEKKLRPKLAFNCVGGKSSTELMRHLDDGGKMVTYGGMSRQPIIIPTGVMIFKRLKAEGFWMTKWNEANRDTDQQDIMFNTIFGLMKEGKLVAPPADRVPFSDYERAISAAVKPYTRKQLLVPDS
ncbi:PREDICTED: trans-2-enoyl-CoA reductase, mitochondrial-like [Priapulus caudatus]|uniref:Enoyl-[acyl-carrier-protein] reductase, mitochondrial n=1 Tax=Priapulus caudatus TaxID=37621 RepID=A0ABM1DZX6_PRICU|nr:PREDICTED: trans-2-enoyl-CoA reductase, mitochondrial-like [Priapulus caudatus]